LAEMKIGTWDDGSSSSASARSNNAFPPVGNFEIGTFSVSTTTSSASTRCQCYKTYFLVIEAADKNARVCFTK
jgi:hypothetical protein